MRENIIGNISLYDMLLYYLLYSFLGWCTEVVYATLKTGKFVNRGFLNGPVCPIYGTGMAICVLLLNTLVDKWFLLFIVGLVFASVLEFLTGFVLEKIFKLKWWDYSKEPFNIKGYICLKFSLLWGLAILLMFKTLVPLTDKIIDFIFASENSIFVKKCFEMYIAGEKIADNTPKKNDGPALLQNEVTHLSMKPLFLVPLFYKQQIL